MGTDRETRPAFLLGRTFAIGEQLATGGGTPVGAERREFWERASSAPRAAFEAMLASIFMAAQSQSSQLSALAESDTATICELSAGDWPERLDDGMADFALGYYSQKSRLLKEPRVRPAGERRRQQPGGHTEIRDWFDPLQFIKVLNVYINQMFGPRWMAFSMPDGRVYVQSSAAVDMIRTVGRQRRASDINYAVTDEDLKKTVVYQAFRILQTELGAIDTSLLHNGDFSARFDVALKDGTVYHRCTYIPFKASAFGELSELEARKTGKVAEVVSVSRC